MLVAGSDGSHVFVVRYRANGKIDRSFAKKGIFRKRIWRSEASVASIVTDRVVVAGAYGRNRTDGSARMFVMRLTKKGKLHKKFGKAGVYRRAHSVANDLLLAGSKVVVAGRQLKPSGALVLRLNARGRIDRAFGHGGATRFSSYGSQETAVVGTSARAVALDPAGRVVLNVGVFRGIGQPDENGLARLRSDGRLDPTFHNGGFQTRVTYGPDGRSARTAGLVVNRDGSMVTAGGVDGRFLLMGYDRDGAPRDIESLARLAKAADD